MTFSSRAKGLLEQSDAVSAAANELEDRHTQDIAYAAAATLHDLAHRESAKASRDEVEPILTLAADATAKEVRAARQKRAVRLGKDVYLPSWTEATIGLPNALLRSELFASSSRNSGYLDEVQIASLQNFTLTFTGHGLNSYDRQVFAHCLNHYRDDRPLSQHESGSWIQTTYFAFARAIGASYGANVHRAIRASLLRLHCASIRVRFERLNVPLPRMIEVAFEEGYLGESSPDEDLKGSDRILFRVDQAIASLFGPTTWTAVPKTALNGYTGLAGWLVSFYSTHSKPFTYSVDKFQNLTGSNCTPSEFRRMLKTALAKLEQETDILIRVGKYKVTTKQVWVCMERWGYSGECPI